MPTRMHGRSTRMSNSDVDGTAKVTNTGKVAAYANADADAEEDAFAEAEAQGIVQDVEGDTTATATVYNDYAFDAYGVVIPNSGLISARATAEAE